MVDRTSLSEVDGRGRGVERDNQSRLRSFLKWARHSFFLRAMGTLMLGVVMSCTDCGTCIYLATAIGCNSCSSGTESGCDFTSCESSDPESVCDDSLDNDEDGEVDCDDMDCVVIGACGENDCNDGRDNDEDGLADCEDQDCCGRLRCRCQCESQCLAGERLCISDESTCAHDCCGAGEECRDGRCIGCETECGAGYEACFTDETHCSHSCCTPGQVCSAGECACDTDCAPGTNPCLTDAWSCTYECCADGDVCREGSCAPLSCASMTEVDTEEHDVSIEWSEQDDTLDLSDMDGCVSSRGAEALYQVDVPARTSLSLLLETVHEGGLHVVDACPPTRCESSLDTESDFVTLWVNDTLAGASIYLFIEQGDQSVDASLDGRLQLSTLTGLECEVAIDAPLDSDGFAWAADAALYPEHESDDACETDSDLAVWFVVDVSGDEGLSVAAWGDGPDFLPVIVVSSGECGELECVAAGEDEVTLQNEGPDSRTYLVAIGWAAAYHGAVNVDISSE